MEGPLEMKAGKILIVGLAASSLTGCGTYNYARNIFAPKPGDSVEFVSANSSSVLIDLNERPQSELQYADNMSKNKCALFGKSSAQLESLNPQGDGRMRASYLCQE